MEIKIVDPRSLVDNPEKARRTRSSPQADALLLATIRAVGIVQPPVVAPQTDGGNGFVIQAGHRRVKQAIAAGLEEIVVLVGEADADGGAMRSLVTTLAHEQLNPVDQWRAIERLVALDWTEEAIGIALALPVRQIKKLRLLANVLPAMLDYMAKGNMPDERQLRTIAAASIEEQKEVWKANKPSKDDPRVWWPTISNGLAKTRMYARDASFGDDLAQAYGIVWIEDLFAPANEDSRHTTDVEAYLGAQQEWMTRNLPKKGVILESNSYGDFKLPPKAERVYGTAKKSDHTAMYLDRDGKVRTVHFRMPEAKKPRGKGNAVEETSEEPIVLAKPRPDVTRKGIDMIGDLRTDALHAALARAPIEDDTLMALLVLAFAGQNVRVDSGAGGDFGYGRRFGRHAASLFDADGRLDFDADTLREAVRGVLIDVLSCRENISRSGILALVAGEVIGADGFLANMGTEEFLSYLSRPALEAACAGTDVSPKKLVKETRAALVEHFAKGHFVHAAALFAPDSTVLGSWLEDRIVVKENEPEQPGAEDGAQGTTPADPAPAPTGDVAGEDLSEGFREAAE